MKKKTNKLNIKKRSQTKTWKKKINKVSRLNLTHWAEIKERGKFYLV